MSESLVLTSDSESEIFCDSLDSVEQFVSIKVKDPVRRGGAQSQHEFHSCQVIHFFFCLQHQAVTSNGFHNGHITESSLCQITPLDSHSKFRHVGAGQGGEGAEDGKGPGRRGRDAGRDASHHNWRDRESKCSPTSSRPAGSVFHWFVLGVFLTCDLFVQ